MSKTRFTNVLVAFSPKAGRSQFGIRQAIERYLEHRGCRVEWVEVGPTTDFSPFNGVDLDLVIAAGGDGTVQQAANWIMAQEHSVPLGILPLGSANVLAASLRLPFFSLRKALDVIFASGCERKIDVGLINGRQRFFMAIAFGVAANTVRSTSRHWKRLLGAWAYAGGFVRSLMRMPEESFSVTIDGKQHKLQAKTMLVFNVNRFFIFKLGPDIRMDDGILDLAVAFPRKFLDSPKIVLSFLLRRYHLEDRLQYLQGKEFQIAWEADDKEIMVDGEAAKYASPMRIGVEREALTVITRKSQ